MRIAVIESHPIFRTAITTLLTTSGFSVAAEGCTAADALSIANEHAPEIVLIDHVFTIITELAALTKVVVFASSGAPEPAVIALDAGAKGYILKTSSEDELVRGLNLVGSGETHITANLAVRVIAAFKNEATRKAVVDTAKLSARELQVVRLLMLGRTNKQIATGLAVSEKTVKHYMTILLQKLNARNRLEAVIAAQKMDTALEAKS